MTTTIGKRGRRKQYEDDQLIEFLQNAADYHDKESLSWIEYEEYRKLNPELPAPQTFAARFGTWHEAVTTAALKIAVNSRSSEKFSDDDIDSALVTAASEDSLTIAQYEKWLKTTEVSAPSARWVIIKRGTWKKALLRAGILVGDHQEDAKYTDVEMIRHMQTAAALRRSRTLSISEYEEYRKANAGPAPRTIVARYKSWTAACEAANLIPLKPGVDHINKKRR